MLATTTPFFLTTSISPGTPSCDEASSSSGSSELASTRRSSTSALQAGHSADVHAVAGDCEVIAFHQQETEIARQRRVFEIGFAERPRRQQADARLVAIGRGAQTVAKGFEERRDALDIHRLVEVGEGARQHQSVFQRIAHAGRRLRAIAEHPPAAIGTAAEIGGIDVEIAATGRLHAAHRPQIFELPAIAAAGIAPDATRLASP